MQYLRKIVIVQTDIFLPVCAGQKASDVHSIWNFT